MNWPDEDINPDSEPLRKKVDGITALLVMVMAVMAFTIVMLAVSHSSNSNRLDVVEQALRTERP